MKSTSLVRWIGSAVIAVVSPTGPFTGGTFAIKTLLKNLSPFLTFSVGIGFSIPDGANYNFSPSNTTGSWFMVPIINDPQAGPMRMPQLDPQFQNPVVTITAGVRQDGGVSRDVPDIVTFSTFADDIEINAIVNQANNPTRAILWAKAFYNANWGLDAEYAATLLARVQLGTISSPPRFIPV